jgi:hypothetical protein
MPGTQSFINPAFPSVVGSSQTPPPGVRAELFTYRATGNYYEWAVPAGVYYAKVTIAGGTGVTAGGTTSFDTIATATGGENPPGGCCCSGPNNGVFSVSTTRLTQQVGASYSCIGQYITSYGGGTSFGGQGTFYLENLVPGTIFRITIGVATASGQNGVCLIEY